MKLQAVKDQIFRDQSDMANALGLSKSKISKVLSGEQNLPSHAVGVLITKYKVDAEWLFSVDDDYTVKLSEDKVDRKEYEQIKREKSELAELVIYYQKQEISRLKNIENVSDTQ